MILVFSYVFCELVQAFGPVAQMSGSVLQLGCIMQGFSNSELEQLQLPLDILDGIAQCGWNCSQVSYTYSSTFVTVSHGRDVGLVPTVVVSVEKCV